MPDRDLLTLFLRLAMVHENWIDRNPYTPKAYVAVAAGLSKDDSANVSYLHCCSTSRIKSDEM